MNGFEWIFIIGICIFIIARIIGWFIKLINAISHEKDYRQKRKINNDVLLPYSKYVQTDDDIKILIDNITIISKKISNIQQKLKVLIDNNQLLKNDTNNKEMSEIINKNNKVIYFLIDLHDQYVAVSIEMFFSWKLYFLGKEDIKTIKIKETIENLQKVMNEYFYKYHPNKITLNQIIESYKKTGQVINEIMDDINSIKIKLIMLQNKIVISNISPIEIEREFNLITSDKDYTKITINLDDLNNEYDRFFSEHEVTYGLKGE